MRTDRLLKLANFLEHHVPDEKFNLWSWGKHGFPECGTTACACGWASVLFQKEGLCLVDSGLELNICYHPEYYSWRAKYYGWHAIQVFFEISRDTAEKLFSIGQYKNPSLCNVVHRIRDFCKEPDKCLS